MVPKLLLEIQELEKHLKRLTAATTPAPDSRVADIALTTEQLRTLKEKRYKQQQEKARAKHRCYGESPTKYWTSLHRTRAPRDLIPAFEREGQRTREGERVYETDAAAMAEMARAHHDDVQKDGDDVTAAPQRERDIVAALESITTRISEQQAADMGATISRDDCDLALKFAKTGTAPGLDGIQYEVWKTLHARYVEDARHPSKVAFDVLELLRAAFDDVQMHGVCESTGFAEGWMSPIYKEKGELTKIVNYRPITLLNTDYKLLTKILALRLAVVAPEIVHPAQAGFVPGRRLHNHTQLARMMMAWAEASEENGAIVALDQEKAYDKISHDYLWRILERFGVPEGFSSVVKSLYRHAVTSVVINGVTSKTYRVYRGVRQGDPLSCLLFDLAIEPLSAMIRASPIRGFNIPHSTTALKATLFADDTTVYLAAEDDFAVLQNVLDRWCSAAKAKFNLKKTEIIPIGSVEYRTQLIGTYRESGQWKNYPQGVHVAEEGEAVRILGAFMGNGVPQSAVWTPKIAKVNAALDRWRAGHMTLVGKRHAVQMVVGGMTQFMTDVQRMPEPVLKKLTKMIRDFVWDDKTHVPVAMDHLYLPVEEGGIKLLDLEARNEAIDVMWLRAYAAMGPDRPLWALVADDLLANHVPRDVIPRDRELRVNTLLQHWAPKSRGLVPELAAIMSAAKKYGVRQEGLAFSRTILRAMPMWDHNKADAHAIRSLAARSAASACLKKNHRVSTVGDCEALAAALLSPTHRPAASCTCNFCEAAITSARCADPNRCYVRASKLLDTLPPKWDPRKPHPEDHEEGDMAAAEA